MRKYSLRMFYEYFKKSEHSKLKRSSCQSENTDITFEVTFELLVIVDHLTDHVNLLVDVEEEAVLCVLHHVVPHHEAGHIGPGHGLLQVRDH